MLDKFTLTFRTKEQQNCVLLQSGENNIENNTGAQKSKKNQRKNSPIVKGKNLLDKHCFQFTTKTNNSLSIKISARIM